MRRKDTKALEKDLYSKKGNYFWETMASDFFESVYQIVRLIPKGKVTSYGAIAVCLGSKSSSRVVGYAMNAAHSVRPKVPAHRVVNRNGQLTGKMHFETPFQMEELLKKEGILVIENQIQNFEKVFWDPNKEIKMP